jgi:cell growth-regulating nucleolar protein
MSEAQKYQGALYKEKPNKKGPKTPNQNAKNNANARNQQPRVEDASASDADVVKSHINIPPPPAPTPPPAGEAKPTYAALKNDNKPVNVFDYLVTDETPNASKVSLATPKEQMAMNPKARSLFEPSNALAKLDTKTDDEGNYDVAYEENGFSYGADPIPPSMYPNEVPNVSTEFVTPAHKKKDRKEKRSATTSEKKRKRGHGDEMSSPQNDIDTPMMDAPSSVANNAGTPMLAHSGLTGGLNRMMRSPSPNADDTPDHIVRAPYNDASSPIKRTRRSGKEAANGDGLGISMKNRAERFVSSMFGGSVVSNGSNASKEDTSRALVRTRRGSSSSGDGQLEVRKKKSHRSRDASGTHERKSKRKSSNPTDGDRPSRRQKQIDERRRSDSRSPHRDSRQVTVYHKSKVLTHGEDPLQREMATHFLSLVSKDSERGTSFHKALKRFHRDFSDEYDADRGRDHGRSRADRERRAEDEKDLWRSLRLRRNDRGEIVVFV